MPKLVLELETVLAGLESIRWDGQLDLNSQCLTWVHLAYVDLLGQLDGVLRACEDEESVSRPGDIAIVDEYEFLLKALPRCYPIVI